MESSTPFIYLRLFYIQDIRTPKLSAAEHKDVGLHTFCTGTALTEAVLCGNLRNTLAEDEFMVEAP